MSQDLVEAREVTLLDLVDRAVEHGVILAGDIAISVADVDLIYLGLRVLLASVERAEELRARPERAEGGVVGEDLKVKSQGESAVGVAARNVGRTRATTSSPRTRPQEETT